MKIEPQHYELAYQLGRRIHEGKMRLTEARDEVASAGVNPNSAVALLNNFRHMLEGTRYTRALSSPLTDNYLTWIRRDYGDAGLANAVSAVSQHLDYYEKRRSVNLRSTRDILAKHAALLPKTPDTFVSPEEVSPSATHVEGTVRQALVNVYERNPAARAACIAHYGNTCQVCSFNFGKTYGQLGDGFIHVHHLKEISSIAKEYEVDPIVDLRPVCPNCHAMLHTSRPALSIEALKQIVATRTHPLRK
jgi:5-methylcytosine-specific restriction protein A